MSERTLVIIQSHSTANDLVARHWPYYELAGCSILGIGRTDTNVRWPTGPENRSLIGTVDIGKEGYIGKGNLVGRFMAILELFLGGYSAYTHCFICENDAIFV